MDISDLQKGLESMIDWIIGADPKDIENYLHNLRSNNPHLSDRQIAEKIISEQSFSSALLGAATGFGGLLTLPATIPIDIVKSWKIQAFTIRCIAYLYGYTSANTDLKTDIFLVLSNGSLEQLKNLVITEALKSAPKHTLKALQNMKQSLLQATAKEGTKYAAKAITKYGGKTIVNYTMKGVSKYLVKALWKVGGRKVVEKGVQKSLGKAVPFLGAVIGGSFDWFATQAVGRLAIEYYANDVPQWLNQVFNLCD